MGCDIHGIFQAKKDGVWVDVPSTYEQGRHYQLFAVLANVRNGYGFAGTKTGEAVDPISEPRGFPEDFALVGGDEHPISNADVLDTWRSQFYKEGEGLWMGDHSYSWLSGDEMLTWYNVAPVVRQTGILERSAYETWDRSPPKNYCGGVWGKNVDLVDEADVDKVPGYTHVRVEWDSPLKEELAYFFDEVQRLTDLHGEIRFVFGFDS